MMWVCGCEEQIQWEIIPIPIVLFPFTCLYSHFHSRTHRTFSIIPIPVGISWDPWDPNRSHSHAYLYSVASDSIALYFIIIIIIIIIIITLGIKDPEGVGKN